MQSEQRETAIEQAAREYEEGELRDLVAERVRGAMRLLVWQLDEGTWSVAVDMLRVGMPVFERNVRRDVIRQRAKELWQERAIADLCERRRTQGVTAAEEVAVLSAVPDTPQLRPGGSHWSVDDPAGYWTLHEADQEATDDA